jgi:regulator of cell morphogenesis and NO signaling
MYKTHKTYIKADMKMSELINENSLLLLVLEHLDIDFVVSDKSVNQICDDNDISLPIFLMITNLYNGFNIKNEGLIPLRDISTLLCFLKNSHKYYKYDKYPEIQRAIEKLKINQDNEEIKLIEKFFDDYFDEVLEHLDYEEENVFPYIYELISDSTEKYNSNFSVNNYREHHTDIETKLTDLKNLLLIHLPLKNDLPLRRQFLFSLFELEFDLKIHSLVEEEILLPLVAKIERISADE